MALVTLDKIPIKYAHYDTDKQTVFFYGAPGSNPLGIPTISIRLSGKIGVRSIVSEVEVDAVDVRWYRAGDGSTLNNMKVTSPGERILALEGGSWHPDNGTGPVNSGCGGIEVRAERNVQQEADSRPGFVGLRATPIGETNVVTQVEIHAARDRPKGYTGMDVLVNDGGNDEWVTMTVDSSGVFRKAGTGGQTAARGCFGMVVLAAPWLLFGIFGFVKAVELALA